MHHRLDAISAAAGAEDLQSKAAGLIAACAWSDNAAAAATGMQAFCSLIRAELLSRSHRAMLLVRCMSAAEAAARPDLVVPRTERPCVLEAWNEVRCLVGRDAVAALEATGERTTVTAVVKAALDECGGVTRGAAATASHELLLVSCLVILGKIDVRAAYQKRAAAWRGLVERHGSGTVVDVVVEVVLAAFDVEEQADEAAASVPAYAFDVQSSAARMAESIVGQEQFGSLLQKSEPFYNVISENAMLREAAYGDEARETRPADFKEQVAAALLLAHAESWRLPDTWAMAAVIRYPAIFTVEWIRGNAAQATAARQLFAALLQS